ncbi:hypothetical protein BGHDH14_bgh00132 [Blumeria hordei DH14]|uniref:Saccharopine dehydrogenase [NAD(+), L-lysine-forming] n=1 Tax=Blumeria graminis f. sp. hordei (strain DH14) TaxID=546991 RepID=N1JH32_BLUG1|nr:hypothetical protein BGHDH14_bgh00132 [Blumeria hordei DH14]
MAKTVLHLRSELGKSLEHRSALTPKTVKELVNAGYTVNVERSPQRVFNDEEFEKSGAKLVDEYSWRGIPTDHIVVGLKELPVEQFPLEHTHIQFAHCFKEQRDWDKVLARFAHGGGTLLDLEFLSDQNGRRVAAFGYHAGFAGAALALKAWAWQLTHPVSEPLPGVSSYPSEGLLVEDVKKSITVGKENCARYPRILVIGAYGRCGKGAIELCLKAGIPSENILGWDMEHTARGGPFSEIVEMDIFINCIYLTEKIPNFIDILSLNVPYRNLSVICDVSADTTNPYNPVPVYTKATTFDEPTVPVDVVLGPPMSVISIDHLPSLLPREASEAFSGDLLPYLLQLNNWRNTPVWAKAEKLFREKLALLPKESCDNSKNE